MVTTATVGSRGLGRNPGPQRHDTAFTAAGRGVRFARLRLYSWLERTGWSPEVREFVEQPSRVHELVARHPMRTLAAVAALEREAAALRNRTFVLREAAPFGVGGLERRLMNRSRIAVYDFDSPLYAGSGDGRLDHRRRRRFEASVRAADVVLAGNDVLAERAEWMNANVVVMPTCVDVDLHPRKTDYALAENPVIGCVGTLSTHRHLQRAANRLLAVSSRTGARILLVNSTHASFGALENMIDRVTIDDDDFGPLTAVDVAIAPVDDIEVERGRTATELLHFAACGVPTVSSGVGAQREVARRVGAVSSVGDGEFEEALLSVLRASTSERAALGENAVAGVRRHYSFERWRDVWCAAVGI